MPCENRDSLEIQFLYRFRQQPHRYWRQPAKGQLNGLKEQSSQVAGRASLAARHHHDPIKRQSQLLKGREDIQMTEVADEMVGEAEQKQFSNQRPDSP